MDNTFYFDTLKTGSCIKFATTLNKLIQKTIESETEIIYLCIGSDRSTGDSLGPLTGHRLSKLNLSNSFVYGTLKNPVHAINLSNYMEMIYDTHRNGFIIAIDASLGSKDHIGYVTLSDAPLKPGLGVKKELQQVGNLSITGIVNFSGMLDNMVLQTTRLSSVMDLSDYITNGIVVASQLRKRNLLSIF